jgi:shikimate dehydrogenase
MGEAGRLSRFAYRAFGSLFTYVAADDRNRTAPGQPTWDEALRMGLDRQTPQVFGLLGGPAAVRSPGPRVWNAVLPRSGRPLAYVALPTARPAAVISMLRADSPAGLSVTMPYKTIVRDLIDAEAPSARRAGSVNTIVREGDRLIGHSTDGAGALSALGAPGRLAGRRVLVLGAGGAARAFVRAAVDAGASVAVAARRPGAAAELAASLGAAAADWGAALDVPFDVLVNATPVGDDGISSPVADSAVLAGRIVLDMVIAREPTPLLRQAEAAGAAERIPGTAMWAHQGVLQMEILTGLRLDAADVRRRAESEA